MDHLNSICPIFCDREGERLYQVGSGVLINFRKHTFLLTAGHVIADLNHADPLIPHKNGQLKFIEGTYAYHKPKEGRKTDFLDYGYFKLEDEFADDLKDDFYIVKEHELGVKTKYEVNELFSFAGYPYRKSNVSGISVKSEFYAYGTIHVHPNKYEHFGCFEDANIVTKFNRKSSFNPAANRVELPVLPHGISGGGVFVWPRPVTSIPPIDRKLVGVGHTWLEECFFIGTRIEIFLDAILINNPSLKI